MFQRDSITRLATHEVANQPPPLCDYNLYDSDPGLQEALKREGAAWAAERVQDFGGVVGSARVLALGEAANRHEPELHAFDRTGARIDEVEFHPAWHELMQLGVGAEVHSIAWTARRAGGHVAHAALEYMLTQAEAGVCCPITMTYASIPALAHAPDLSAEWAPRILSTAYDRRIVPATEKAGATIGMAMTEKQGGSDVRANTTRAVANGDGSYTLTGHKWFCSAPMCDAFLTLAYTGNGLTSFLVPRWTPQGERNAIQIMRLKDKLGDRANASSEIEYHGAWAERIGEEDRGVRTIIEMVQHTRLDCTIAPAAYMRQALANALWHTNHRTAFQRKLIDQPLMRQVLADMAVEAEAATALTFRLARSFDSAAHNPMEAAFMRIATPVGKYWLNKRVVNFVYEAMESHGGAGYVEENAMPRLFRQSPLNSIWEGSGNVICLDVLRAMMKEPESVAAFINELEAAHGENHALDRATDALKNRLVQPPGEHEARHLVEQMAVALQASVLVRQGPAAIADAYCATRLSEYPGFVYGGSGAEMDVEAILSRAIPAA